MLNRVDCKLNRCATREQYLETCRPEARTPLMGKFASIWRDMIDRTTRRQFSAREAIKWVAYETQKANDELCAKSNLGLNYTVPIRRGARQTSSPSRRIL